MTKVEACQLAHAVQIGKPRSYVEAAKKLADYVLDQEREERVRTANAAAQQATSGEKETKP